MYPTHFSDILCELGCSMKVSRREFLESSAAAVAAAGNGETRVRAVDEFPWLDWLWAWKNPHPDKGIVELRFEPKTGTTSVMGVSGGPASSQPLRWEPRRKAISSLPDGVKFDPAPNAEGLLAQIQLDMGQVISAERLMLYPQKSWAGTYNNKPPEISENKILVDYTAHPDARFHLADDRLVAVSDLVAGTTAGPPVSSEIRGAKKIVFRAIDRGSKKPVPVEQHSCVNNEQSVLVRDGIAV